MIVDFFLNGVLVVFDALWSVVPPWTITVDVSALAPLRANITRFDGVLPVTEAFQLLGITSIALAFMYAVKSVYKIVGWVRGSG